MLMTTFVLQFHFPPFRLILATKNWKNFRSPTGETSKIGKMVTLAFSSQKSVPLTILSPAERAIFLCTKVSVKRMQNFLVIRIFIVFFRGFQKFFLFWLALVRILNNTVVVYNLPQLQIPNSSKLSWKGRPH